MAYAPFQRSCLLIPFNEVPHLFVVLNDPCKDGMCLLAMASSIKNGRAHDNACELNDGDHEFVNKPSYIVYRIAEISRATHISNMVEKNYYHEKDPVSEEVFARIVDGLEASEETRPSVVKYAKDVGIISAKK